MKKNFAKSVAQKLFLAFTGPRKVIYSWVPQVALERTTPPRKTRANEKFFVICSSFLYICVLMLLGWWLGCFKAFLKGSF